MGALLLLPKLHPPYRFVMDYLAKDAGYLKELQPTQSHQAWLTYFGERKPTKAEGVDVASKKSKLWKWQQ